MKIGSFIVASALVLGAHAGPAAAQAMSCDNMSPLPAAVLPDMAQPPGWAVAENEVVDPDAEAEEEDGDAGALPDDDPCGTIILAPFDILNGPDAEPAVA